MNKEKLPLTFTVADTGYGEVITALGLKKQAAAKIPVKTGDNTNGGSRPPSTPHRKVRTMSTTHTAPVTAPVATVAPAGGDVVPAPAPEKGLWLKKTGKAVGDAALQGGVTFGLALVAGFGAMLGAAGGAWLIGKIGGKAADAPIAPPV